MARFVPENEKYEDIYITKYWESRGILRARARTYPSGGREYADVRLPKTSMFLPGNSWSRSYGEACDRVAELAMRRMNTLKRTLDKVRKLKDGAATYNLTVEVLEVTGSSR